LQYLKIKAILHISKTLKIQMGDEVIISLNDHKIHGTVVNSGKEKLIQMRPSTYWERYTS
jgi:hypothetical protein